MCVKNDKLRLIWGKFSGFRGGEKNGFAGSKCIMLDFEDWTLGFAN